MIDVPLESQEALPALNPFKGGALFYSFTAPYGPTHTERFKFRGALGVAGAKNTSQQNVNPSLLESLDPATLSGLYICSILSDGLIARITHTRRNTNLSTLMSYNQ